MSNISHCTVSQESPKDITVRSSLVQAKTTACYMLRMKQDTWL